MLIELTHLPADGQKFEHQYEADELNVAQHEFSLAQLPLVKGRVTKIGAETRVIGTLAAQLTAECDRCLENATVPVQRDFDLFYWPEAAPASAGSETELHDRDLDVSFYQDERIDIDELVLEQLVLSLPTRLLCKEDCRGLCSQCGTNLNFETCNCQAEIDPRWQALADLKK